MCTLWCGTAAGSDGGAAGSDGGAAGWFCGAARIPPPSLSLGPLSRPLTAISSLQRCRGTERGLGPGRDFTAAVRPCGTGLAPAVPEMTECIVGQSAMVLRDIRTGEADRCRDGGRSRFASSPLQITYRRDESRFGQGA